MASSSEINKHIRALYDEHHGALTAKILLEAATPESHPLHSHFEWDDTIAARKHRLDQARRLIRSCRVTFKDKAGTERSVREFHSVIVRNPEHTASSGLGPERIRVYRATEDVAKDRVSAEALSAQFKLEWKAFRDRWENFDEFVKMFGPGGTGPGSSKPGNGKK